jgi:FAD/FMN-containing dehydrogenase
VVFLPKGPADVSAVVKHLRKHNVPMSIMGGGHSLSGASLKHGAALIRLKHMNHVHVDPKEKSAWVGAGALLADIDNEAAGVLASMTKGAKCRSSETGTNECQRLINRQWRD